MMEVLNNWSYKTCKIPVKNRHHQQTNTQLFTGRMPFLSPNQQRLLFFYIPHPEMLRNKTTAVSK